MKKTMKISLLSALTLVLSSLGTPVQATGWVDLIFGRDRDFKPYLENGTEPHNAQWRRESWTVADWAPSTGAGMEQVDQFFKAGIFTDYNHTTLYRSPTLRVGETFYHLSGYDKRRVMATFDHVYQATATKAGTIFLKDDHTGRTVGIYTRDGLQLQ